MISLHRTKLASSLSALALLGWLAFDSQGHAHADAATSAGYVDDAVERLRQSDPQAAVIQLKNALREDPGNVEARRMLGEIYLNQRRFPEAEKELQRAQEAVPDADVVILLGRALLGQGKTDDTLALIDEAGAGDADQNRALALLKAETLLSLERTAEARAALAAESEANPLNIDVSLTDARISLAERDVEAAKIKVGRALEIDPESIPALMLDAQIKTSEGRHVDALAALDKLAELSPGNDHIKVMRAEVLIRRAKFDDAERMVTGVLERRPDDIAANFLLATVQSNKGDLVDADATLRKIADVTRDVDEVTLLSGVVKLGIGQHAQAETLLAKYVARAPENLPVRRLLAGLRLKQGSPRAAIDTLRPVTGPDSSDVVSLQLRSSAEIRVGDADDARETLKRLASLGQSPSAAQAATLLAVLDSPPEQMPSDQARLDMARVLDLMRNGEGDEAFATAQTLAEQYPESPLALNLFGMTHLAGDGDEDMARQLFEQAIDLDPTYLDAHRNIDRLDIRAARFDVLEERLTRRIADGLDPEKTTLQLARLQAGRGHSEDALATLRTQVDAQAGSVLLRRALLANAAQQGRKDEAAAVAEGLLALGDAGDPVAFSVVGDHFFNNGDYDAAVFAYTKLNQARPDTPELLIALAQSQYRAGDTEAARASLEHVRSIQPNHFVANNSLVDLDIEAGRLDDALAFAERVGTEAPDQGARLISKVLIEKNEGGKAIAVLEQALAETPSPAVTQALFRLRQKLGLEDEAVLGLKSWVATNPDDIGALDLLGDTHVARRELDSALPYFERAYQLTLNDPVLMNDLSWVRHELGRPGAEDLARRAYQISRNPAISDTLGWILVQKGETEDGIRLLREAHQELQDNPDIRFHLAYALHSQGDAEGAKALLRDLESWPQPFLERERALELLEQLKNS
ncbi:MAG: XrtA/PEP-CTERM system TPR-repeat protein PrsT [Geminicoccaceae bacterium]